MKKPILIGLIVTQIILVVVVGVLAYNQVKPVDDPSQIREVLMQAISSLKKPAPVDAKTGDIYFPEYRVYLPRTDDLVPTLSYGVYENKLSVGTVAVVGSEQLYTAQTSKELFDKLPKVQSCERGVQIAEEKLDSGDDTSELILAHKVKMDEDRTLYIHYEETCAELKSLADSLANIKQY